MSKGKPSSRILTLDLLRGYFLLVILIDHLAQFPGVFELITGKGWLWSSAAEGFFIISGIMVGLIRGKELQHQSFKLVRNKLWQRAGQLYLWAVGLTLAFTAIGLLFAGHADLKPGLLAGAPIPVIVGQAMTFQYVYGWADFLSHYAICMALAPIALYALHRGWWRQLIVGSLLLWWLRGANFVMAWQLLFVGGMIGGYYLKSMESWVAGWSATTRRQLAGWWLTMTATTVALSVMVVHVRPWLIETGSAGSQRAELGWGLQYIDNLTGEWFNKLALAPGRIVIAGLWFGALYILFRRYEAGINRAFGWLLVLMGRNSLFVYITQSVVVFLVPLFLPSTANIVVNVVLNSLVILLVWRITLLYGRDQQLKHKLRANIAESELKPGFRPVSLPTQTHFNLES